MSLFFICHLFHAKATRDFCFRSPNPDYLRSWPTYKAPFWQYLNLTADATSIGEDEFSDQCEFWWNILPNVLSYNDREDEEQLDEEEDAEDVDFSFCQ